MGNYLGTSSDKKVILLIEDNIDDERLTLRALRKNNIINEVVVAYDGQEGLDFLFSEGSFSGRDQSLMPALIVLDLTLPKLSGIEVLKRIREATSTRSIPVVVLTADEDPAKVGQCYDLGANSFIRKPTDPGEFSEMVLQVAMYWLLLNRVVPSSSPS